MEETRADPSTSGEGELGNDTRPLSKKEEEPPFFPPALSEYGVGEGELEGPGDGRERPGGFFLPLCSPRAKETSRMWHLA